LPGTMNSRAIISSVFLQLPLFSMERNKISGVLPLDCFPVAECSLYNIPVRRDIWYEKHIPVVDLRVKANLPAKQYVRALFQYPDQAVVSPITMRSCMDALHIDKRFRYQTSP